MEVGDLVCSRWDISRGHTKPLGMITDMKNWIRGGKTYTTIYVLLFKSRTVDGLNIDQLVKFEDSNCE